MLAAYTEKDPKGNDPNEAFITLSVVIDTVYHDQKGCPGTYNVTQKINSPQGRNNVITHNLVGDMTCEVK